MDIEFLLYYLQTDKVINSEEVEDINSEKTPLLQVQKLLSLIGTKPAEDYINFLTALDRNGQRDVSRIFSNNSVTGNIL